MSNVHTLTEQNDFQAERLKRIVEQDARLKGGGGGGTSDTMVPLKDYVDKSDEVVETRLNARIDKIATKGTVWGAAATVLGIVLAVLAFGGDRFDAGTSLSSLSSVMSEQNKRDDAQDRKLDEILRRLPPPAQKQGK